MLRIALIIAVAVAVVVGFTRLTVRNAAPAAAVETPVDAAPEPVVAEPATEEPAAEAPALDVYEETAPAGDDIADEAGTPPDADPAAPAEEGAPEGADDAAATSEPN